MQKSEATEIFPGFGATLERHRAEPTLPTYVWTLPPSHLASTVRRTLSLRYRILKRVLDVVLSSVLLVIVLPLALVISVCIRVTSRGPIFYREERIGRFGVPFRIFKFRSMHTPEYLTEVLGLLEEDREHLHLRTILKRRGDPRVTPIGAVLRKWSLDELPQFLNVLIGDMSLVGPRPIVEAERAMYGPMMSFYNLVTPGMTGLWQVSGRSDVSFAQRAYLDSLYGCEWRMTNDLKILARTIPAVLKKTGAY